MAPPGQRASKCSTEGGRGLAGEEVAAGASPVAGATRSSAGLSGLAVSRPPPRRPALSRAGRGTGLAIHIAAQLRRGSRRQAS